MNTNLLDLHCYEDFPNDTNFYYYMILAKSPKDKSPINGIRGDGYCSIWAILIGWSLLKNRQQLILNELGNFCTQPKNMYELVQILISAAKLLQTNKNELLDTFNIISQSKIEEWELDILIEQLSQSSKTIKTIQGECHFKLLSIMFGIQIEVLDELKNKVYKFGNSNYDTIRISTNGNHYSVYNNKESKDLSHFTNRYWWNKQWENHPHVTNNNLIPIIN